MYTIVLNSGLKLQEFLNSIHKIWKTWEVTIKWGRRGSKPIAPRAIKVKFTHVT